MNLMLNAIVKNEADKIERMLKSVAPHITSWVIIDTGSADDTKERITKFFRECGIPGEIHDVPFIDFEQARNAALFWARQRAPAYQAEYFLLCDADMELVVLDPQAFHSSTDTNPLALALQQRAGAVRYMNTRILTTLGDFKYKGVTHEYLDVMSQHLSPDVAYFHDHADGSNRALKCKRDIRLLIAALKREPDNVRYMYYLASSYRDAGKYAEAAKWFKRRVKAGGWDEEVWSAQCGYAMALRDLGDHSGFIREMLAAYNMRPSRAETMYDLSVWLREHDQPAAALAMAEAVEHLHVSTDSLFVNNYVYEAGIKNEIAITSFYVPGKMDKGRRVNDELVLSKAPYVTAARNNAYWYVRPLGEVAPSFAWTPIPFEPPAGLVALNPSVCIWQDQLWCNVRAVNYRIDEQGQYIVAAINGTATAENPIDTRNFLVGLGCDPLTQTHQMCPPIAWECYRPGNLPCEFPLVTGFEDMRIYETSDGDLAFSATCRQIVEDGQCEQVRGKLRPAPGAAGYDTIGFTRMLRSPRVTEKNWAPIIGSSLFMHRPGHVVHGDGSDAFVNEAPVAVDHLSGSSQVIPWNGARSIAVIHTAHALPGHEYKRYYYHRFIEYDRHYRVRRISQPFVFHDKVIEFCAGLAYHPRNPLKLVLSYGFKDEEARIATISCEDVEKLLWEGHNYERT